MRNCLLGSAFLNSRGQFLRHPILSPSRGWEEVETTKLETQHSILKVAVFRCQVWTICSSRVVRWPTEIFVFGRMRDSKGTSACHEQTTIIADSMHVCRTAERVWPASIALSSPPFPNGCSWSSASLCVRDASLFARRALYPRLSHAPSPPACTLACHTHPRRRMHPRPPHRHPPRPLFSPAARIRTHPRLPRPLFSPAARTPLTP